jgi:hypothetical protein
MSVPFSSTTSLPLTVLFLALLVVAGLTPGELAAQGNKLLWVGEEVWVEGPAEVQPGVARDNPDVAVDSLGRAIHVFEVWNATEGSGLDIFLRRFDLQGLAIDAAPVLVNTLIEGSQNYPRVAVRNDDAFFVIWQSVEFDEDFGSNVRLVRGQLFDNNGAKQGSEQLITQVSSGVFAYELSASVAALDNGTFAVVWESRKGFGTDSQPCSPGSPVGCNSYSIQGRLISSSGVVSGAQFQINDDPNGGQEDPAVAATADGGFFTVWHSTNSVGTDTGHAVQGRRFHSNGTANGSDFQVNTTTTGVQWHADIERNRDGDLLVVFESPNVVNNFGNVRGRWYGANGTPSGNDFFLSTIQPAERQDNPRVAGGQDVFIAIWEVGVEGIGSDDSNSAINGRVIVGPNQFEGGQFQANVYEPAYQQFPAIGGNSFHVATSWVASQSPFDGGVIQVVSRSFYLCDLFCDDFEGGNTDNWSSVTSP